MIIPDSESDEHSFRDCSSFKLESGHGIALAITTTTPLGRIPGRHDGKGAICRGYICPSGGVAVFRVVASAKRDRIVTVDDDTRRTRLVKGIRSLNRHSARCAGRGSRHSRSIARPHDTITQRPYRYGRCRTSPGDEPAEGFRGSVNSLTPPAHTEQYQNHRCPAPDVQNLLVERLLPGPFPICRAKSQRLIESVRRLVPPAAGD